ncbi:MAG: hypothetical protein MPJ50_07905, partial [Pirellulales bacterium]|nr:hypothetical protein [Pirellulales bacterium]
MNVLYLILACSLGNNAALVDGHVEPDEEIVRHSSGLFAAPQTVDVPGEDLSDASISADLQPVSDTITVKGTSGCGCAYCLGSHHHSWP